MTHLALLFATLARGVAWGFAFGVGWLVYMTAMLRSTYDGAPSLLLQPLMAALCSGIAVAFAASVRLVLRLVSRGTWAVKPHWAAFTLALGLFVLTFGRALGLRFAGVDPSSGESVSVLHPAAAIAAYFGVVFAIANWPIFTGPSARDASRPRYARGSSLGPRRS